MDIVRADNEVTIRPFATNDGEEFFELIDANRKHLCRWIPALDDVRSVRDERDALRRLAARQREGDILGGAIDYLGQIVGSASISLLNSQHRAPALGYWIAEDVQGRGIATRACRALLERAFEERAVGRVEIMVATENTASRAVAERLGFTLREELPGRLRRGGRLHDVAVYSLLASDWTPPAG